MTSPASRCAALAACAGSTAGKPRREIAGIEAVAGGGGVDRHHDFRHRHEFLRAAGGDQRAVGTVLDDDLADAERLQPGDRRSPGGIAPQHGLVIEGRQRDIDALERFDENGARARQVAFPAARPEIAVERHLGALLARGFEQREKAAEAVVRIERQRDAGEINQPRRHQAFGNPHPVGQLEQVARRRAIAPVAKAALAGRTIFNEAQPRQPAGNAQDQIGRKRPRRQRAP